MSYMYIYTSRCCPHFSDGLFRAMKHAWRDHQYIGSTARLINNEPLGKGHHYLIIAKSAYRLDLCGPKWLLGWSMFPTDGHKHTLWGTTG